MKNKRPILILFFMLLVFHTNSILVYGNFSEIVKKENKICLKQDLYIKEKPCCDNPDNNDDGCNRTGDNLSCTCPGAANPPVFLNSLQINAPTDFYFLKTE